MDDEEKGTGQKIYILHDTLSSHPENRHTGFADP
jgi:hypothetical protein